MNLFRGVRSRLFAWKTAIVPLVFLFIGGMDGAKNLGVAFLDHPFFDRDLWWVSIVGVILFNLALLAYLQPVIALAAGCAEGRGGDRISKAAVGRFRGLVPFIVVLSIALLFFIDALDFLILGPNEMKGLFSIFKGTVNAGSGFFLGVLVSFLLENQLFPAKKLVLRLDSDAKLPYQSLYSKIFLVLAAIAVLLLVKTLASLPSFILIERPAGAVPLADSVDQKAAVHWAEKSSHVLFNPSRYGVKNALQVFAAQMVAYLVFIGLMLRQVKRLIKEPLETIRGRLGDLNRGRPEDLAAIEVVQNDEFASVFTEINRLIETQKSALSASEQQLAHVLEGAADPIVVLDGEGSIRLFNPAAEEFFGYGAEEAKRLSFCALIELPPNVVQACETSSLPLIDYLKDGNAPLSRLMGLRKDGSRKPFESSISVTATGEGPLFTAILRDITARLEVEEALTSAKIAAEKANRMKSEFLANMSHELRTPLNAVLGFTQLMSGDKNLTDGQRNKIEIISRSGEHLLSLINDILDISKIEAGKFELHSAVFDLGSFVGDLRDMFLLRCKGKGLSLDAEVLEGLPRYVRGDLGKLRQVMINLIGNAVKFTAEGGIGIVVGLDGERIRFAVNDSGKGIPADEIDLIMQPFTQSSNNENEGGTGLGLAISQRFIELMGGRLEVRSQVGEGSTFSFAVPLEKTDEKPEAAEPELKAIAVKGGSEVLALIVDDKETNRLVLKEMLEKVGFSVMEAENGLEAVERTRQFRPRAVFMDIKMPVMDGYEAAGRIKADPETSDVPVFALTASAFKHDEDRICAAGFDGFLAKPFKQSSLFRLIRDKTDIEMEYETSATAAEPAPAAESESAETVRAVLGDEGIEALDDMATINDFTGIRKYAENLSAELPGFAALLSRYADAFDEEALSALIDSIRTGKENH